MFFNKELFLKNATKNKALFEYSFTELKNNSDGDRKARAKGIVTLFEGVIQGPDGQARTLFKVPSQTNPGSDYQVTVAVIVPKSSLFAIAKGKWDPKVFASTLKTADVKVHCTCMDFLMGGQKYNLGPQGKYKGATLTDKTQPSYKTMDPTAPDYRDPQRIHVLCKHCIAVATNFTANSFNIMKAIRGFVSEVKVDDKKTKDMDEGKKPLKKDIELVDMDQEKANKITEGLVHGGEMLQEEESTLEKDNQTPMEDGEEVKDIVETSPIEPVEQVEQVEPFEEVESVEQVEPFDAVDEQVQETNLQKNPESNEVGQKLVPEIDKSVKKVGEQIEPSNPVKMDSDLNVKDGSEVVLEKDKEVPNVKENIRSVNGPISKENEGKSNPRDIIYKRPTSI